MEKRKNMQNSQQNKSPFPAMEEEVLNFWEKNKIFEKSVERKSPKGDYVFYDGPPFATGTPHYGHIVASIMKDVVPRYWTMKGFKVERKWGWDCHGLPIENIVEKEMKTKSKKDIEKMGVDKFNEACRSKVLTYVDEWKKVIRRLGRWADMENAYKTMDKDYMESIWWVFSELYKKGLIYEGYKSMHICPRCETTLSQQEVAEGYKDVKDLSATVKFKVRSTKLEVGSDGDIYILAWTTTPWTLIGNVALAVGEDIEYFLVKILESGSSNINHGDYYVFSESFFTGKGAYPAGQEYIYLFNCANKNDIFRTLKVQKIKQFKGKDLVGLEYEPLFDYYASAPSAPAGVLGALKNIENGWKVYAANFVNTEEGTGVVHIAPAFGEDDMNLGRQENLPFIQHIGMDGVFKPEIKDFAGLHVKPIENPQETDVEIIKYLAHKNLLFSKEKYEHSYPHCWRCDTPLLNYATSSWFVKVTDIKDKALKLAKEINWTPKHLKEGRFGQWLEGARDWSISRQRFWASVMPIWKCEKCEELKVLSSVAELEKLAGQKVNDLHKHIVDKITFPCEKCNGEMKRIPDVLDCWFESSSMPYAQTHYPFENEQKFEENFPAEFIAEGVDQTRAWFYYLHVIASAIKNKPAFKNVIVNGIVLAEDGKKMAKRLQNYPDPMEIMEKHGADKLRYYLCSGSVVKAEDFNFSEKDLIEQTRFFNTLFNVLTFYKMFADDLEVKDLEEKDLVNVLDKWITSRLEETKKIVTEKMDHYDLHAIREIPVFIDYLSIWYVQCSRDRFKSDNEVDKLCALKTLRHTLYHLACIMAPFMPFTAEHIYQELGVDVESVHLKAWPEIKEKWIDKVVLEKMDLAMIATRMGKSARDAAQIKVKQPLSILWLDIKGLNFEEGDVLEKEILQIIKDRVNVKEVFKISDNNEKSISKQRSGAVDSIEFSTEYQKGNNITTSDYKDGDNFVRLDIGLTPELKQEGIKRELVRAINNARKEAGMTIQDRAIIYYQTNSKDIKEVFAKFSEDIKKDTLSDDIKIGESDKTVKINGEELELKVEKK